ncbi:MAG: AraC family transcriptional regulator [Cyanobacteria bacterium P01_C01_bin.72]
MSSNAITLDYSQDCKPTRELVTAALSHFPILTSKDTDWDGMYLAYDRIMQPGKTQEIVTPQYSVLIFTETPQLVTSRRNIAGEVKQESIQVADVVIIPANATHQVEWSRPGSWIMLGFEPRIFDRALYEAVDLDNIEIATHFAQNDPLIHQLGLQLKQEVETGGLGGRLYADVIANLMAVHLFNHYATTKPQIKTYTDGLPIYKLKRVKEYINTHLDKSLSLDELAQVVQMSAGYFSRLFKQSTGYTPHQYLIRRRVEKAKQLLRQRQLSIADVAYQVGFANQGHLNYHFKKYTGITPKTMQKSDD